MEMMSDLKTCRCCKARRASEEKTPRLLRPVFIKGKVAPIWLCDHCDGDAFPAASVIEARLISGEL